jgi:hypothetical protein
MREKKKSVTPFHGIEPQFMNSLGSILVTIMNKPTLAPLMTKDAEKRVPKKLWRLIYVMRTAH